MRFSDCLWPAQCNGALFVPKLIAITNPLVVFVTYAAADYTFGFEQASYPVICIVSEFRHKDRFRRKSESRHKKEFRRKSEYRHKIQTQASWSK